MLERDAEISRMKELVNSGVAFNEEQLLFALIEGADVHTAHRARWEYFLEVCKVRDDICKGLYQVPADRLPKVQALYRGIVAPGELGRFCSQMLAFICQKFFWRTMPRADFKKFVQENPLKYPPKFYKNVDEFVEDPGSNCPLIGPSPFIESIQSVFVQP